MTNKEKFLLELEKRIVEKPINIGEYVACMDSRMGSIYFYNERNQDAIYTSPFWETDEDVIFVDKESYGTKKIPFVLTGDMDADIKTYFDLITNHLN